MKALRVAVVSSRSRFCDVEANLEHFAELVEKASEKGAQLVCFPELALTSYTIAARVFDVAEKVPGPTTSRLAALAKSMGVFISAGMAERAGPRFYICQVVVGPQGYIGKYRKHHPTDGELAAGFSAGRSFPTFQIDGFKMGINICFDGRHGDTLEPLRKARVDFIHHPHGNTLGLGKSAEEWTRGKLCYFVQRAIHARAYILLNNSAGDTLSPQGPVSFGSGAMIIDPLGQAIRRTTHKGRGEKMLMGELVKPLSAWIPKFELRRWQEL